MDYYCTSCGRHFDSVFCDHFEKGGKYITACPCCGKVLSEMNINEEVDSEISVEEEMMLEEFEEAQKLKSENKNFDIIDYFSKLEKKPENFEAINNEIYEAHVDQQKKYEKTCAEIKAKWSFGGSNTPDFRAISAQFGKKKEEKK